jgi:iron(III) transport system substrate-binding protein
MLQNRGERLQFFGPRQGFCKQKWRIADGAIPGRESVVTASRLDRRGVIAGLAASAVPAAATAQRPPPGYPRSYQRIIDAASRERQLTIYSATDSRGLAEVLAGFKALYPFIIVRYEDLAASEVYRRFLAEAARKRVVADLLMNSAMDLQIKLVNDGYSQPYASPEKPNLPEWAIWKNEAYAVSAEPIVFAYNRRLMPATDVPRSHSDLQALLERKRADYTGKIALYNPESSSTGFLYITQDVQLDRGTWNLVRAIGRTKPSMYNSTGEMIQKLTSGQHLFAYNIIGSYALAQQAKDPSFRVIVPNDYVLMSSRIALIPKEAPHPASAKLFLDYMLSRSGQALLAKQHMTPLRSDVRQVELSVDPTRVRAIRVGPALLTNLDQLTRNNFLNQWRRAFAA